MAQLEAAASLGAKARPLLDAPVHAALGTLGPDGSPQVSTMWVTREGDHLLFSTLAGRQKARNIRRDPRVSVLLWVPEQPVSSVEIRGSAEIVSGSARGRGRRFCRGGSRGPATGRNARRGG